MRKGFTLLELIFVIVIMGILAKFGTELLYKTYENYVYSNVFNRLQDQSEMAVKLIANRLQYRIKDSTIKRTTFNSAPAIPIGNDTAGGELVVEWMGTDIDGLRGTGRPEWSGFIDLSDSNATALSTPGSGYGDNTDGAVFFIGSDVDLNANFGWDNAGTPLATQAAAIHRVKFATNGTRRLLLADGTDDFSNAVGGVYEFYQFTQSAYGVYLDTGTNKLYFYHDYEPWAGQSMADGEHELIMENVKSFDFTALGDILIVQVCVSDMGVTGVGEYAICKEKVVF